MSEVIRAIKERRSVRKYKDGLPPKSDIEQIVEAGLFAANGMGKQETAIVVVTNKSLRDRISEMNRKIGGWDEGFDELYYVRIDDSSFAVEPWETEEEKTDEV